MSEADENDIEEVPEVPEEVQQLAHSIRALKGHLTRKIRSVEKVLADAGSRPSSHVVLRLLEFQKSIDDQYARIETAYSELMELDEERYSDYDTELDRESDRKDDAVSKILAALNTAQERPGTSVRDRPRATVHEPKVKPNKALEPHVLTKDHTAVEMRAWSRKFKSWYSSSNMQQASLQEQQSYFRMVVDAHLMEKQLW